MTLDWVQDADTEYQPAWLGAQSTARYESGVFSWDFDIEELGDRQIGVGLMVNPPDWGFFGYLGAGERAWAYDAYEGAIVTKTEAIHEGLPVLKGRGVVTVRMDLVRRNSFTFLVNGIETPEVKLPRGCTVLPAACLLKKGQRVALHNLKRLG